MSSKQLTCNYTNSDQKGFWQRLKMRMDKLGLNEVEVAEACNLDCTDLLDKKFDATESRSRALSQALNCNLHWLMFGVGPTEAYYKPQVNDKIFAQFSDGRVGNFKVVGVEASSYVLQYEDRNEVVSIPLQDISMISKKVQYHRNVQLDRDGDSCHIILSGRLDFQSSDEWHEVINEIVKIEPKSITVDCTELKTISSMGLGLLISAYKLTRDLQCSFKMNKVSGQALNALKDTCLDRILLVE